MSVQTEIDRIIQAVAEAHEKVLEKGGTTAVPYLVANLKTAIDSIPLGVKLPELTNPAAATDLLRGKQMIDQNGAAVNGAMPQAFWESTVSAIDDNGCVDAKIRTTQAGYMPNGYENTRKIQVAAVHNGGNYVPRELEAVRIYAGYYLTGDIYLEPIPLNYKNIRGVTATAARVLSGSRFVAADGEEYEGTMANNGATAGTLDGLNSTSVSVPEGYTDGGEITFDDTALAARIDAI